jgi:hypothetical protein
MGGLSADEDKDNAGIAVGAGVDVGDDRDCFLSDGGGDDRDCFLSDGDGDDRDCFLSDDDFAGDACNDAVDDAGDDGDCFLSDA